MLKVHYTWYSWEEGGVMWKGTDNFDKIHPIISLHFNMTYYHEHNVLLFFQQHYIFSPFAGNHHVYIHITKNMCKQWYYSWAFWEYGLKRELYLKYFMLIYWHFYRLHIFISKYICCLITFLFVDLFYL
jgi:hypothetical protein